MPTFFNPPTVHAPSPSYSHAAAHALSGRRLVISGQIGMAPDGTVPEGLEAQIAQAFDNLIAVLRAGDMDIANLVKIVTYVTVPDAIVPFRTVRQAKLGDHRCAATFLQIAALVRPELLVEIEGEAVAD
ncbi:RidA family protein [Phreatobacter aquaticus]|uniref:RidA family protein n=1 Tax=Phreatobacter aquaticus TaxID=2570229 RepID=A0A4D7QFT0_9HYPH|nr:RidA family protein [Phreatobacter aquaticus]QCK86028.1 RidA family protein [Phreatobacter aquaticus]